ncbi:MAG: dihydroorotase [Sphingobacteriales bacterium]|nr:MAG: dihydroorotase [Sphingobacteriales bacterium]
MVYCGCAAVFAGRNIAYSLLEMKNILIQKAVIVDQESPFHLQRKDILVKDGIISAIEDDIAEQADAEVFSGDDIYVSNGWMDLRANFWDPGFEHKEDLISGCEAAAYGGFTNVALLPETSPNVATKSQVEYLISKTANQLVNIYPLAAIAPDKENKSISEMYDLANAGALAFSSGYRAIDNYSFLLHAMQYAWGIGKKLMLFSQNKSVTGNGIVNEGVVSVQIGTKSAPALAEAIEVNNLIMLSRYANIPVHISCISTKQGLDLIINARNEGLQVTADISIQHLYFNEEALLGFDTNFKLRPPLRTEEDRLALCDALLKYDFLQVVSDHTPHEEDSKHCEFELASYGTASLQTVFSQLLNIYGIEKMPQLVTILANRPRQVFDLPKQNIATGKNADLTIFSPNHIWELNEKTSKSKSKNNPLWNTSLTGKALAIANKGKFRILS